MKRLTSLLVNKLKLVGSRCIGLGNWGQASMSISPLGLYALILSHVLPIWFKFLVNIGSYWQIRIVIDLYQYNNLMCIGFGNVLSKYPQNIGYYQPISHIIDYNRYIDQLHLYKFFYFFIYPILLFSSFFQILQMLLSSSPTLISLPSHQKYLFFFVNLVLKNHIQFYQG